jgi:predicted metal-dependent hydrolase
VAVNASGEVVLTIPRYATKAEARAFLLSRVDWVREQLAALAQQAPAVAMRPLRWDGRDVLPLRGTETPVLWMRASLSRPQVRLAEDAIRIFAPPETRPEQLLRVLKAALLREARLEAEDLLNQEAHRLGLRWSDLRIGDPRSQWGSCTREGVVSLSWRLLLAPTAVFRYVVIHELCHLPHPDHSPRFWALVAQQMPDWAEHRDWLKRQGAGLHRWLAKPTADAPPPQADLFG